MGTASILVAFFVALALASTQGYVRDRTGDSHHIGGSGSIGGSSRPSGSRPGSNRPGGIGGDTRPGVVSKRNTPKQILPDAVQQLLDQIKTVVDDYHHGVSTKRLAAGLRAIAVQARRVIDITSTEVTEKDVLTFVAEVSSSFLAMLNTEAKHESPTLGFAINLLSKIADRIAQDPNRMFVAVHAIEETAGSVADVLSGIVEEFENAIGKRRIYPDCPLAPGNPEDISGSKSWVNPDGSITTIGGYAYPCKPYWGIHFEHSLDERMARLAVKRQTTWGGHVNTGPSGTTGGIHGSHTTPGGTTYGGHVEHGPSGTSGGVSASHTWGHSDGSSTSVGGYVDHNPNSGTSGGIGITHTFGGKRKRSWDYGGSVNTGPSGTSGEVHGSHTHTHSDGSTTSVGGHISHSENGGTSGGVSVEHSSDGK